ncbi:MAG: hypothetical protein JWO28_1447, partial [Hyphomicrobiales bacterium]|nr:hypothetical protein [Hyphomicrobiales bacterium]
MDTLASANVRDELHIAARIERLPYSPWHV